ncbi:rhodanese-like domain-containing protein [Salinisphaera sp. Q1T1-3]|uniref:rhodanese-like domain-containing protein n=1 Tax=Salinisphaera sp. Q1T1-3 TaxID=2321229 RepID=UPI000E7191B8|nr:rhodanese-like domain-containing protein [Salinisphaera sp. Q1T1-3]RJS93472.1 hypothetical protein D3260_07225 [Salinisphaera sp. Q1T1-3]
MFERIRQFIGASDRDDPRAPYLSEDTPMIDHHAARTAQTDGAVLIDVREVDEWQAGHIAAARHISLPLLASDPEIDLPLDQPIVTYCKVGARAERAAEILRACGYEDVRAMGGGYADWAAAGYPVE